MLVLLTVAAGCVDAASYLGLGQVLTAAMTGNTILLGLAIGQAKIQAALRSCAALVGFVLGAVLAAAIAKRGAKDAVWPRGVTATLAVELVVLVAFALGWHFAGEEAAEMANDLYMLIGAAGFAMGMQSVAVHRLRVAGVSTTYVTGTLTNSAVRFVGWLRALRGAAAARSAEPDPEQSGQAAKVNGPGYPLLVWLAYGAGAVFAGGVELWWPDAPVFLVIAGDTVELRWFSAALLLPILIIAAIATTAAIGHRLGRVDASRSR